MVQAGLSVDFPNQRTWDRSIPNVLARAFCVMPLEVLLRIRLTALGFRPLVR